MLDDVLNSRARSEESWLVDAVWSSRTPPARAWRTFEELARWIGIGKVRTATVLGISRGTTNAWKIGREPQPANARRLYRTHTIVKTLVRRLGLEETRGWLETGEPSPLDLLARGEFAAVDRAASALVFDGGTQESERVGAFMPEPGDDGTTEEHGPVEAIPRPAPTACSAPPRAVINEHIQRPWAENVKEAPAHDQTLRSTNTAAWSDACWLPFSISG